MSRSLLALVAIFLLFSFWYLPMMVEARPSWLKKGVYACYRFLEAYTLNGSLGGGRYCWRVVEVDGRFAVLEVTLETENFTRSVNVTIDVETMSLVEDGEVWGKAYFWIDLVRLPSPYRDRAVVRNITLVMDWLGETVSNPKVSRIHHLGKPIQTGVGPIDMVVTVFTRTNITYLKAGKLEIMFTPGLYIACSYDAKYGILIDGEGYMDDILSQKFGIIGFKLMSKKGEYARWIVLDDTNLELEISKGGVNIISLLRENYVYILLLIMAIIFIVAFLKGRRV